MMTDKEKEDIEGKFGAVHLWKELRSKGYFNNEAGDKILKILLSGIKVVEGDRGEEENKNES